MISLSLQPLTLQRSSLGIGPFLLQSSQKALFPIDGWGVPGRRPPVDRSILLWFPDDSDDILCHLMEFILQDPLQSPRNECEEPSGRRVYMGGRARSPCHGPVCGHVHGAWCCVVLHTHAMTKGDGVVSTEWRP